MKRFLLLSYSLFGVLLLQCSLERFDASYHCLLIARVDAISKLSLLLIARVLSRVP
ncbi:hypothetical protein AMTRI_Chr07g76520 [Amborella trichopoda]